MRSVSISANMPSAVCVAGKGDNKEIWLHTNIREEQSLTETEIGKTEGTQFFCDEAYMILPTEDCPSIEELENDFEAWFEYAAAWHPAKKKTLAELQADVEYIAALAGIDLEV